MKMRASLAKVLIYGMAVLSITAILLLIASHNGRFASRYSGAAMSLLAANDAAKPASAKADLKWAMAYGKLPMGFEENQGQTNSDVRFLSHGQGYELFLTPQEAVLALRHSRQEDLSPRNRVTALKDLRRESKPQKASILRMRLAGANSASEIAGLDKLPGRTDYFMGNNAKDWQTQIPSFARVRYTGIYPGVDLVFYGNQRHLEYDFIVAPGADPNAIALDVAGPRKLRIDATGNLVMSVPDGQVELKKPVVYQEVNGKRQEIAANYALSGYHRVNFEFSEYDRTKPLIVDPVLNYSTYLGGSSSGDVAYGIAVDSSGNAYLAGQTFNIAFPLSAGTIGYNPNAPDPGVATNGAVFVSELNPAGTQELYFSYLGGTGVAEGADLAYGIAVDSSGSIYIAGQTFSTNFPTLNGLTIAGNALGTGFISKLNPAVGGSASLLYSSYLGGTAGGDLARGIAVDASQNAYIVGLTFSSDFPVQGAFQTTPSSTFGNAFLTKIDTTATGPASLIYSTYLGGNDANETNIGFGEWAFGVAVDSSSNAYLVGVTTSTNSTGFPVGPSTFQTSPPVANTTGATFVSRIDTTQTGASSLIYSTYLAGSTSDFGFGIAAGANNVAYVTGQTSSTDFPTTPGSYSSTGSSAGVVFLSLLDTTKTGATSLPYSTLLGGTFGDSGQAVQVDSTGKAYVTGSTNSAAPGSTFPVTPGALQTSSANLQGVAFVSEINPGGNGAADLVYSTLFGGSGNGSTPDRGYGIALDSSNNAYIGGQTASTDFPIYPTTVPTAFQTVLPPGTTGAFAAKLTLQPTVTVTPTTLSFGTVLDGTPSVAQLVTITNNTGTVVPLTLSLTGTNPADFTAGGGASTCGATLAANNTPCTVSVTFTPSAIINGAESANLVVGYTAYGFVNSQTVTLTGTGTTVALTVSPGVLTFAGQLVTTTSATQALTVTNSSVSSGAVSLTNATDFSITVAAGGPAGCTATTTPANTVCIYNVAFNPAAGDTGALTSTFSVTAGVSTQTATLNGTGWDFNFSPATQSVSVAPGGSASPTVTANFLGGFAGTVNLTCTGSIPMGSCTVPASVSASGPVTVTITTKGSSVAPPSSFRFPPISRRQVVLIGFSVLLLFTLPFARPRRSKVGLVGALVMIIGLTACSGSSGTPAGPYPLTITGSSGGVTRTATITLTVT